MSKKPWGGRFSQQTDKHVEGFTASIDIDKRFYAYDIEGSIAHCRMLSKTAIIPEADAELMIRGLQQIKEEIAFAGNFHRTGFLRLEIGRTFGCVSSHLVVDE